MILVTGGAGYIGSHFVETYLAQSQSNQIVVIDDLSEGHAEALSADSRVHFFAENVGNLTAVKAILSRFPIEACVHFASSCYVGESQKNPPKYFHNNVVNGLNLMRALHESNITKFVLSSTCAVYGNPKHLPIDETHDQEPINVYGLTKYMLEKALAAYAQQCGWSYVALRYFNAAGADQSGKLGESHSPETHIIPLALQTALGNRHELEIYGDDYDTPDGTCIRDYIHITDLAVAHSLALELINAGGRSEAINLGTTTGASVKEIVDLCRSVSGKEIPVKISPRRDGDPPKLVANNDKAKAVLGWTPKFELEEIVRTAWLWEQNRRY
jgi:UDP-glucose 4-epimerase